MKNSVIVDVLNIVIAFIIVLTIIAHLTKADRYTNRIVEDINTHKLYIQEINQLIEVGDTITCKIDSNWITVKVIK